MDLKGSLVDTNLKIYINDNAINFLKTLPISKDLPHNVVSIIKNELSYESTSNASKKNKIESPKIKVEDLNNLAKINRAVNLIKNNDYPKSKVTEENLQEDRQVDIKEVNDSKKGKVLQNDKKMQNEKRNDTEGNNVIHDEKQLQHKINGDIHNINLKPYLLTSDLDWLYNYIKNKHDNGDNTIPYLHVLLEGSNIDMPRNEMLKRNPDLEARCVKLRAQQEAREYRKMTKGVDNVRMRYPEDSISYQLKQVNRQLIAVGQFIISIFAGFLFGFRGVEWMVGNLDFGFRLLLGVMCALVIALAEIYFLAKKLNEEMNIPETVQLGGPPKFACEKNTKSHQD